MALTAYAMLFLTLDSMTTHGLGGMVFPIGIGTCIIGFTVYARFRLGERFRRLDLAGLTLTLGGLGLLMLPAS